MIGTLGFFIIYYSTSITLVITGLILAGLGIDSYISLTIVYLSEISSKFLYFLDEIKKIKNKQINKNIEFLNII